MKKIKDKIVKILNLFIIGIIFIKNKTFGMPLNVAVQPMYGVPPESWWDKFLRIFSKIAWIIIPVVVLIIYIIGMAVYFKKSKIDKKTKNKIIIWSIVLFVIIAIAIYIVYIMNH